MFSINLVPIEIKDKILAARHAASTLSIAIICVIVFIVMGIIANIANTTVLEPNLIDAKDQLAKSNAQLAQFDTYQKQALTINDRVKVASQIDEKRARWSAIIQDLISSVPQTVQFTSLAASADKSPNFILSATTDSERNIILFKDKLESSAFFKNVAFKSSTSAPNSGATTGSTDTTTTTTKKVSFSLEFDLEQLFNNLKVKATK